MENITFIDFFIGVILMLWIILSLMTIFMTNDSVLRKKGYQEEYIDFIKSSTKKRNINVAIVMPIVGGISALIVWIFIKEINSPKSIMYISLLWIILLIPFPILDHIRTKKKHKELVRKTNSEIVIDFKYEILHLMFNPYLEVLASILVIGFFLLYMEYFHPMFIHVFILWALYSVGRSSSYLTAIQLKDGYKYLFIFIMLNQAIIIFHLFREISSRSKCEECLNNFGLTIGLIAGTYLFLKFIYYLFSYAKLNLKLKSQ
jgi:hypothetical protein